MREPHPKREYLEAAGALHPHPERVRAQLSIEEKRRLADHVIDNSGSPEETDRQVRVLYGVLTG